MRFKACAKINLTLEILGRRHDRYHEVASVMQAVDLCDQIDIEPAQDLVFESDIAEVQPEHDLALRAALLLRLAGESARGARIQVKKYIPLAAGLGGGSSDAACVLRALNHLWSLGLPRERLQQLATDLGADVPFFLTGGVALAEGRGEQVTPLAGAPTRWFVLMCPPIRIPAKTATLFQMLEPAMFTDGQRSRSLAESLKRGHRHAETDLVNVFESVSSRVFPELDSYRQRFLNAGASSVHLSGAGPSLFTVCLDEASGRVLHQSCRSAGLQVFLVKGQPSLV